MGPSLTSLFFNRMSHLKTVALFWLFPCNPGGPSLHLTGRGCTAIWLVETLALTPTLSPRRGRTVAHRRQYWQPIPSATPHDPGAAESDLLPMNRVARGDQDTAVLAGCYAGHCRTTSFSQNRRSPRQQNGGCPINSPPKAMAWLMFSISLPWWPCWANQLRPRVPRRPAPADRVP